MRILRLYLARELLKGWLLVMLILATVFTLLLLIDEVDRVNVRYTINDALRYLLGTLPQRVIDLAPVTVLLGTLIALGNMARHSELIVMRSTGMSIWTLLMHLALPVLAMMLTLALMTEFVAAPLYQQAEIKRQVIRSGKLDLLGKTGLWANDGNRVIHVRKLHLGHIPQGVEVFNFSDDGQLITAVRGREAEVSEARHWTLQGVVRKDFSSGEMQTSRSKILDIGAVWSEEELPVLALSPAGMAPSTLHEYIQHLDNTEQKSDRVRLVFWQKVTIPFSAVAMVLLATPIGAGLGNGRSGNFGLQLALGALLGIGFYMLSQIIHNAGLLLGLPTGLVAVAPIVLVCVLALLLIARRR